MKEFTRVYIEPTYGRKSFYKKCFVDIYEDGTKVLTSYTTKVAEITVDGVFRRLWHGYSATTMRHINEFVAQFTDLNEGGKKWWDNLPTETA